MFATVYTDILLKFKVINYILSHRISGEAKQCCHRESAGIILKQP